MADNWQNLFHFLVLLIQFADDDDIGILLKNTNIDLSKSGINEHTKTENTYKEVMLYLTSVSSFSVQKYLHYLKDEHNDLTKEDILKTIREMVKECQPIGLYQHLLALCENFYSYNFKLRSNKDLTRIFKVLINNYTNFKFYYSFNKKKLFKIIFDDDTNEDLFEISSYMKYKPYIISYKNNKTYLYNTEKGTEPSIDLTLKTNSELCTLDYFMTANEQITKALSNEGEMQNCNWCNPTPDGNTKGKCDNCKNLLEELNKLKKQINDEDLNKWDFNAKIREISIEKCDDYLNLRYERKKILEKFLTEVSNKTSVHKLTIRQIKKLIKISFNK